MIRMTTYFCVRPRPGAGNAPETGNPRGGRSCFGRHQASATSLPEREPSSNCGHPRASAARNSRVAVSIPRSIQHRKCHCGPACLCGNGRPDYSGIDPERPGAAIQRSRASSAPRAVSPGPDRRRAPVREMARLRQRPKGAAPGACAAIMGRQGRWIIEARRVRAPSPWGARAARRARPRSRSRPGARSRNPRTSPPESGRACRSCSSAWG